MALQHTRQLHVILQWSNVVRCQLTDASIVDRVDILPGQTGCIDQSVNIRVFSMDGQAEGTPGCMVPRLDYVCRRPDARTAIRAKVEKHQWRA